ncbi:MAG: glycosyltransferase [Bacilli bacterium]|nr:glycosyltransferase [Bacilli bacterium]
MFIDIIFTAISADSLQKLNLFIQIITIMNLVIGWGLNVIYFYQHFYALVSIFTKPKKYPKAKTLHKYAYLICAHGEDKVVGNLVRSILEQDYPKELMHVFVVADNCTDNTANVAREAGATVFERTSDQKGKSWALDYAFKKLVKEYESEGFEALFLFDADNLVSKEYTMKMNDLYDSGVKVGTGFRDSKNFGSGIIAGCASMMFYRECLIMHHSRSLLNVGTYASGTGFYISYDMVKDMNGWNFHTLDEDIEFSLDCAYRGIKIKYCEDAVFYDEQPTSVDASRKQRMRWARGNHEVFWKYFICKKDKPKGKLKFQTLYEMVIHTTPIPVLSILWFIVYILFNLIWFLVTDAPISDFFDFAAVPTLWFLGMVFGVVLIHSIIVLCKYGRKIKAPWYKKIISGFLFPFYAAIFAFWSFVTLFKKVSWAKVEHNTSTSIEELEDKK